MDEMIWREKSSASREDMEEIIRWEDVPAFIDEVKQMARGLLRKERHAESLQTTALVLTALRRQRLQEQEWEHVTWPNRRYFFGAVYRAMRRALVDHARSRMTQKRQAEVLVSPETLQLLDLKTTLNNEPSQIVALVEALEWLKQDQPQWVEALEHRFYGGLTYAETARIMEVDRKTIQRWFERSQLVLRQEIASLLNEAS